MTPALQNPVSPKLLMGHRAPKLEIQTLEGNSWSLADQTPKTYTMIVFYRGLHCPICETYLSALKEKLATLTSLGVNVIAISGDERDLAAIMADRAQLQTITVGYGLSPADMKAWGLYMSKGHFVKEPALFSEPAVFLVKPDGTLYLANIGTHPFARADLDSLISGIDYVIANQYPDRGTEA